MSFWKSAINLSGVVKREHFPFAEMPVIALPNFVVVAQNAFPTHDIGQPCTLNACADPSSGFGRRHSTNSANADSE